MTPDQLSDTAALLFGVSRAALFGKERTQRVTRARHALAWALRRNDWSLEAIGEYLHRDHTSIIYALARIERDAARNPRLAEQLRGLYSDETEPLFDWRARIVALEARVIELELQLEATTNA